MKRIRNFDRASVERVIGDFQRVDAIKYAEKFPHRDELSKVTRRCLFELIAQNQLTIHHATGKDVSTTTEPE